MKGGIMKKNHVWVIESREKGKGWYPEDFELSRNKARDVAWWGRKRFTRLEFRVVMYESKK